MDFSKPPPSFSVPPPTMNSMTKQYAMRMMHRPPLNPPGFINRSGFLPHNGGGPPPNILPPNGGQPPLNVRPGFSPHGNFPPIPGPGRFNTRGGFGPWGMQNAPRGPGPRGPFNPSHLPGPRPMQAYQSDSLFDSDSPHCHEETFPLNQDNRQGQQNNCGGHGFRGRGGQGFRGQRAHNNQQRGQQQPKKKKEKVDKRDLAENNVFFCDICDRGFKTEEKYNEHVDGHVKCSYKDCSFIAAPKLVQLHVQMQHRTGVAKKVWSLESAEDIKKWIEDRKKNYPTPDNVAKKQETMKEKSSRGEVIQTKEFGKMRGRDRGRGRGRQRGRGGNGSFREFHNQRQKTNAHNEKEKSVSGLDKEQVVGNDPNTENSDSDDEAPEEVKTCKSRAINKDNINSGDTVHNTSDLHQPPSLKDPESTSGTGGLYLLAGYGDSSSEEEDSETEGKSPTKIQSKSENKQSASHNEPPSPSYEEEAVNGDSDPLSAILSCSTTHSLTIIAHQTTASSSHCSTQLSVSGKSKKGFRTNHLNSDSVDNSQPSQVSLEQDWEQSEDTKAIEATVDDKKEEGEGGSELRTKDANRKRKSEVDGSNKDRNKKAKLDRRRPNPNKRNYTLLEKLLAPDIRRERNKILQCVHYIVKNKFFMDWKNNGC